MKVVKLFYKLKAKIGKNIIRYKVISIFKSIEWWQAKWLFIDIVF